MKRFRYKGDLSKHIKRYHPGHTQPLTPVPLQEDEITTISLNNKSQNAPGKSTHTVVASSSGMQFKTSKMSASNAKTASSTIGERDNKFFLPLLPKHPVQQSDLPGFSKPKSDTNTSFNIITPTTLALTDNNPTDSLMDDNVLDLLTYDSDNSLLSSNLSASGLIQTVGPSGQKPRIQIQQPTSATPHANISKVSFVVSKPPQGLVSSAKLGTQSAILMRQQTQSNPLLPPAPSQITTGRAIISPTMVQATSKLQEALLHGKPRTITNFNRGEKVTLVTAAGITNNGPQTTRFAVPTSTVVKPRQQTVIQNSLSVANNSNAGFRLATSPKVDLSNKPKTLTISISEVFACAQPLPLQEEARQHNKGKMTTMADLEPQAASLGPLNAVLQQKGITLATQNTTKPNEAPILSSPFFRQITTHPQQNIAGLQQKPTILSTVALQQPQSTKPTTAIQIQNDNGIPNRVTQQSPASKFSTVIKSNSPKKAFVCDHSGCNKSFDKASLLRKHARLHSKQCKFVCDVCQKGFESHSKKEDHYRKHTGVKPFLCDICGHSFRYKGMWY